MCSWVGKRKLQAPLSHGHGVTLRQLNTLELGFLRSDYETTESPLMARSGPGRNVQAKSAVGGDADVMSRWA